MATKYVAKDGNDSNGGTSYSDAKLTIGAAITAATAGDTISIGPGVYNEAVTMSKLLILQGDGYAVIDGTGGLGTGISSTATSSGQNVRDLIIQNFTTGATDNSAGGSAAFIFLRCWFRACTTGLIKSSGAVTDLGFTQCLFTSCTQAIHLNTNTQSASFSRCTFADNTTGIIKAVSCTVTVRHCVFSNNTKHYNFTNVSGTITLDFNCVYFDGTANSTWNATTTTVFATWQSTSGKDASSLSQNPIFEDRAKRLYGLHYTSAIITSLEDPLGGTGYGAGHRMFPVIGFSVSDVSGNWANRILSNTVVNASNNVELDAGQSEGYVRTGVIDLGSVRRIRRATITTNIDANTAPSDVPDYVTTDLQPRRLTMRWRQSSTSFVAGDSSPSWVEFEPSALGPDLNTLTRYVQFEVYLRSNGV